MKADQTLQYLDDQKRAIEALITQLDEVQVTFNAMFDEFRASHDETLDRLTDQVFGQIEAISPELRAAIDEQLTAERQHIDERREKLREEYLPKRKEEADAVLVKAQAQNAAIRRLNPQLDEQEEEYKREKSELESQLEGLNAEIKQKSRGLGVVRHFIVITKADRERNFILGKLDSTNRSLYKVRRDWERKREMVEEKQAEHQKQWQLESIAVARLQTELDQLDDDASREDLALRRAIRQVLDDLKEPSPSSDPALGEGLKKMMELNIQTDNYHGGLASVGGFIGLLRGINSGLAAIRKSIDGLQREQQMHSSYLKPLDFSLPTPVQAFHKQWPALAEQFADEKTIGASPAEFSANVEPILKGPLAQAEIESMFGGLGHMINQATKHW